MLRKWLFVFLIAIGAVSEAARLCRDVVPTRASRIKPKYKIADSQITLYTAADLGFHDKILKMNTDRGLWEIAAIIPEKRKQRTIPLENVLLMPGTRNDDASYYAKMTVDKKTKKDVIEFYPISDSKKIINLLDKHLDLTWQTYLKMGTVKADEIEAFKRTEYELPPQRKVTFVNSDPKSGKTLAILRLYDGSPFPTSYFSDLATHHEAPDTDPRIPIERRYPNINFRKESPYIFEPGRIAKSSELEEGVLNYQFYQVAFYFLTKFGFLMTGPTEFFVKGRVYVEVTARGVPRYMNSVSDGGLGFHLAYIINGRPKKADKLSLSDLNLDPENTEVKYILYSPIQEFINNHYGEQKVRPASEVYPDVVSDVLSGH